MNSMNIADRLNEQYSCIDRSEFAGYLVQDCVSASHVKVIFLCESPHKEEVEEKRPLVGKSGTSIVTVLRGFEIIGDEEFCDDISIGQLLRAHPTQFNWIGLMNACQLPMQKDAYKSCVVQNHKWLLEDLEKIRGKGSLTPVQQDIRCMIVEDLKQRLSVILCDASTKPLVFACGEVARKIVKLTGINCVALARTPHPSRYQWEMGLELFRTMKCIREIAHSASSTSSN